MEEEYRGNENFGPTEYDFDFDFEFDLRFTAFEYALIGLYLVVAIPVILASNLVPKTLLRRKNGEEPLAKSPEDREFLQAELCVGPCCLWPQASRG